MTKKLVNVAFKAYAQTSLYVCEIEDIKVGDFVVVHKWNEEATGRIISFSKESSFSLKKPQQVIRRATPQEVNQVADVFGIAKNPDFIDENEEEESFLTSSGYGTKELNKILKKYNKQGAEAEAEEKATEAEEDGMPGYWRYVAIGILALYFLKDYIFEP